MWIVRFELDTARRVAAALKDIEWMPQLVVPRRRVYICVVLWLLNGRMHAYIHTGETRVAESAYIYLST